MQNDPATQLTPEQHWNLQCHGVHQANEGITRTRNSGLRYIRRLIAGKVTSDSARQFTAAKLAAALKPIALPKFPSSQRAPRTPTNTTPRKPANNDRHPDYAHCVEAVNHVNPVSFVDFAPAPPLPPLPPKPIDPAEIPELTDQVAKLEDLLAAHLRQLGWDRTGSTVAENPATRDYLRNRADDTEFRYLPELRQELAETKDRLEQSIALRDSLAVNTTCVPATTEPANNNPAAPVSIAAAPATSPPDATAALNSIIALTAEVAEASDKLRKIESAAASSTDPAEKLYLTNLAAEISRDDLAPTQHKLAAAQAVIDKANPSPSPAPAIAPTAEEPAPAPAAEPEPTDPEAIAREAAALKAEWATLEDLRFGIGNELIALQRRKRHESHTPAWAAQAQDLFDRCVREKLDPTVMRQYTISQRLAQLGHKLE